MLETSAERQAMMTDRAVIGAGCLRCLYDAPFADALDVSSTAPTLMVFLEDVERLSVDVGTVIDSIHTDLGRTYGAHTVRVVRPRDDGELIELELEA